MPDDIVIRVESLSKRYRLGLIGLNTRWPEFRMLNAEGPLN